MKKKIFTKEEHIKFANDLFHSAEILSPWFGRFLIGFRKTDPQYIVFKQILHLMTSELCNFMDSHYYKVDDDKEHNSPYYGTQDDHRLEHKKPAAY